MLKKLKGMRIEKRLKTSYAIILGMMTTASLLGMVLLLIIVSRYNYTLTNYAFPQGDIALAMNEFAEVRSATRAIIGYEEQSAIDTAVAQHEEATAELDRLMKVIEPSLVTPEGLEAFEQIETALIKYYEIEARVLEIGNTTDQELCAQAQEIAINELAPVYNEADATFEHLMAINVEKGDSEHAILNVLQGVLIAVMAVATIFAFAMATRIAVFISKSISKPIKGLVERLDTFSQGDISTPFPVNNYDDEIADMVNAVGDASSKIQRIVADLRRIFDEMAGGNFTVQTSCESEYVGEYKDLLESIIQMSHQVDETLRDVKSSSDMVLSGATNLAEAAQALAEGATDQAASVEEMQAMIGEISSGLEKTVQDIDGSYMSAKNCADDAQKSHEEMRTMMAAMDRISETSQKIGNIISEIEDIASQTNLLSLNAAIEAARAGDAGRGFAVVADQIRSLAEQSAKSAVNTRELIEGSISEVEIGNKAAVRTSEVLENVVSSVRSIADTSKTISEMSNQHVMAMKQADQGIARISEVVQANSATAQEASATSQELSAQAIGMDDLVKRFKLKG